VKKAEAVGTKIPEKKIANGANGVACKNNNAGELAAGDFGKEKCQCTGEQVINGETKFWSECHHINGWLW